MPQIKNAQLRFRIIDKALRNKFSPFPNKEDLRQKCEDALFGTTSGEHISDSTIEKDLFNMRIDHDAPIKYSKREKGYFYDDENYSIDDIPLTADDMEAIDFAAKTLLQFRDVDIFKQFGNAIDKIVGRVEVTQDNTEEFIQFEKALSDKGNEFISPLLEAIKQSLWVKFSYASFVTGVEKQRKVLPLLLKEYRNRWYLISFDSDKSDFITYALDRLKDLELTSETGKKPSEFNADNFFEHAIGITSGNTEPQKVLLEVQPIAAKYMISQPIHSSQKVVKESSKNVKIEFFVNVSEEFIRELMSYGGDAKVISPISLKNEMKNRAKKILEHPVV